MSYNAEDLKVEEIGLGEVIERININNQEINNKVKKINELIKSIDETVWNSPEKKEIDEQLTMYIESQEKQIAEDLNSCVTGLKDALQAHLDSNARLKVATKNLTNLEV